MIPPIESIQYLVDVFIEGGYAEEEDLDHLDAIHRWLRDEEAARDAAFKRRVEGRDVNPDYNTATTICGPCRNGLVHSKCAIYDGWVTEPREYDNPSEMPVNRDGEDAPLDRETIPENRSTYTIVDSEGNKYFFTP